MSNRFGAIVLAASLAAGAASAARSADYYESTRYRSAEPEILVGVVRVPSCGDPRVLAQIEDQFEYGAPRVIPAPLTVAEFSNLQERAYFPIEGHRQIERRYCQGEAMISGGDIKSFAPRTTVYYVIEYPMGFASIGWRAEGCFLGFDEWRVYGANCESLRRF